MNAFDHTILLAFNRFAQHSWLFDKTINLLSGTHLLKGAVLAAALWWAWLLPRSERNENDLARRHVLLTMVACVVAVALGKLVQMVNGYRPRPMHQPDLHLVLPYGVSPELMKDWSAFPSDHAVMFFALSAGLWFVSRRAGWLAIAFSTVFVLLPRIYLGLHHPTDLMAGAALGATVAIGINRGLVDAPWVVRAVAWTRDKPQWAGPLLFLATYQLAEMFDDLRAIGSAVIKAAGGHGG
jgi:undecaprenyl-diphosphatase